MDESTTAVVHDAKEESNKQWKFNSLVCFDLETTGLPGLSPSSFGITEFAFVGVVRSHIKAESITTLPRVVHKLTFTVYPQNTISLDSSLLTGLRNDQLETIKPWDTNSFELLLKFLNLLPPPVCLVSHNGYAFDFPIFKQHIVQIKMLLPDHVIFVDSLPAFRTILGDVMKSSALIEKLIEEMDSENDILIRVAEEEEAKMGGVFATKHPEHTPDSKILTNNCNPNQKNNANLANMIPNPGKSNVRRCLFPTKYPASYKLSDIYRYLFNESPNGVHNSEEDAITLLKCILKVAPDFFKYANENHITFNSIKVI